MIIDLMKYKRSATSLFRKMRFILYAKLTDL